VGVTGREAEGISSEGCGAFQAVGSTGGGCPAGLCPRAVIREKGGRGSRMHPRSPADAYREGRGGTGQREVLLRQLLLLLMVSGEGRVGMIRHRLLLLRLLVLVVELRMYLVLVLVVVMLQMLQMLLLLPLLVMMVLLRGGRRDSVLLAHDAAAGSLWLVDEGGHHGGGTN